MAEWKPFDLKWGRSIWYCSACEESTEVPTHLGTPMYNFCPMCGANMNMKKADRKTESNTEFPNNCKNHCGKATEMVKDEPKTQTETQNSNKNSNVISVYDGVSETDCEACELDGKADVCKVCRVSYYTPQPKYPWK